MNILFVGDVVGRPGRTALKSALAELREDCNVDFVVANGENAAGGFGITQKIADELFSMGVDVLTSGNHIFSKKEVLELFKKEDRLLRPANYPEGTPGRGSGVYETRRGQKVGVLNLLGRVFMDPMDCPFRAAEKEIAKLKNETPVILVDFHAEATAEKQAMGWFLDGKVSAVIGTHTHVPTADERVLPGGTGYITDAGMTGAYRSCIGLEVSHAVERFLTSRTTPFVVASGDEAVSAVCADVDETAGSCRKIKRLFAGENLFENPVSLNAEAEARVTVPGRSFSRG